MDNQKIISKLRFYSKENSAGIFEKKYADGYVITIDVEKKAINYGEKIKSDSATTQNFSQPENFVVLECVNRLLEKGYKPEDIVLENTWKLGRQEKGRLDILVKKEGKSFLMIECKTYGEEFQNEFAKMKRDGGQLFTYFQQDTNAELLMLYASKLENSQIITETKIIKIEEEFRSAGNVKNAFALWNKNFSDVDFWNKPPYDIQIESFTKNNLRELNETEGRALFNKFATILRKHSVSDKPNAFNKIFNLFLAKLYDEQKRQNQELEFHWREEDNPIDFQVRLFNLHTQGLYAFLEKELAGIYDKDFEGYKSKEDLLEKKKNILKINKIYDIKEVFDDDTFEQNHRVLKEVVQLIEKYQIRYPRKQRHLSDFFEQLLTTGLKQEAGQYFTPPAVAKFIVKSLPLTNILEKEINQPAPSLPAAIDYAAGSGHFITEILEEYQNSIENLDTSDFYPKAQKEIAAWKADPYNWAAKYIYGIEKDYRLVKVAKVGCYFYGDGLAQIILGDGLDSFDKSKSYVGLLKDNAKKPQFSILVSNPPYSVDGVRDDLEYIGAENEFTLFENLTYDSNNIETLFVERAAQLLKEDGVAGIVLPSSILSNGGIYAKTREIILQYFDIIAIAQFSGNTFMATNTNTVTLFLRKRNETEVERIKKAAYELAEKYPKTQEDLTINGIEKPVGKYFDHTQQTELNAEKFYYFVLNFHQKIVLVKTGEKENEKRFLGYKIEKRRGSEGYHAIQRGKTIEECTQLFDDRRFDNPQKASTYIYKAFGNEFPPIHETLINNVFYADLVDMLTFDRNGFDKNISLAVKKKVRYEEIWGTDKIIELSEISVIQKGTSITKEKTIEGQYPVVAGGQEPAYFHNEFNRNGNIITASASGAYSGFINYFNNSIFASDCNTIQSKDEKNISTKLIYLFLKSIQNEIYGLQRGQAQPHVYSEDLAKVKIPLPPLEIQQKIVSEIEVLEKKENEAKGEIEKLGDEITNKINSTNNHKTLKLGDVCEMKAGNFVKVGDISDNYKESLFPCYGGNGLRGYTKTFTHEGKYSLVGRQGALCGNVHLVDGKFHATEHALVVTPKQNIDTVWLYHKLAAMNLNQYATGTAQPGLSVVNLTSVLTSIPPLSVQQQIVTDIENIETQIAALETELKEIPKQKEEILNRYL